MNTRIRIRATLALLVVAVLGSPLVRDASAACFTTPSPARFTPPPALFGAVPAAALDDRDSPSPVGLWNSEFLLGTGPARYDQSFQIIHADGTEMMVSNGLPPALGNVCVGIWKQTGPRTFALKHMTWNWDGGGGFAGTFLLTVTIRLDRRGNTYSGSWSADSYKPDGELIPELHAEGVARGTRIGF